MSGVHDDLATLRRTLGPRVAKTHASYLELVRNETIAALDRVEAELGRLTARRSRYAEGRYTACMEALSAAEAELARLTQERDESLRLRDEWMGLAKSYERTLVQVTRRDEASQASLLRMQEALNEHAFRAEAAERALDEAQEALVRVLGDRRPMPYCKGGTSTCESCVGSCGVEEYEGTISRALAASAPREPQVPHHPECGGLVPVPCPRCDAQKREARDA